MKEEIKESRWNKFLDFMDSVAPFFTFLTAIGGPLATALAWKSIINSNKDAQLEIIKAEDESWLKRQEYINQRINGTKN